MILSTLCILIAFLVGVYVGQLSNWVRCDEYQKQAIKAQRVAIEHYNKAIELMKEHSVK